MWLDKLLHQYLESKGLTIYSLEFAQLAENNARELELFKKREKDSKLKIHILESEKSFLKKKLKDKCSVIDSLIFFFFSFLALCVVFSNLSN